MSFVYTNVESSQISKIAYDEDDNKLRVIFKNNREFEYFNIPFNIYQELLNSESIGKYFHHNIKNIYCYGEVK